MNPGVGIVGAGLIGGKRAANLKGARLVAVADLDAARAAALAGAHGAQAEGSWEALVCRSDISIVVVATTNDALLPCALAALRAGKHVLVEKPAGRSPDEVRCLMEAARHGGPLLRVGFNHRFHPALLKAKALLECGAAGPLMYIRARYGHGGRIDYDKEWRADPARSGGGELLDQGVHLIDLCRWMSGDLRLAFGRASTFFWEMPVEDNGFLFLESSDGRTCAFLHASCTEWKNLFDFEIFGRTAKIEVSGLGRSYGTEELRIYKMKPEMGPPEIETTPFPGDDTSWQAEFNAFLNEIRGTPSSIATIEDALAAVEIVYGAYQQSARGSPR